MRLTTASRMQVVKKEEKEGKVREFIKRDIDARTQGNAGGADRTYLLIARGPDSPVVRAMASLAAEIEAAGIEVMAVLAYTTGDATGTSRYRATHRCRRLADARFLEAHEQLVLGPSTVWLGDCMRREPAKRDAYECHADDAQEVANFARTSFFRLWKAARPVGHDLVQAAEPVKAAEPVPPLAVASADVSRPLVASTRH